MGADFIFTTIIINEDKNIKNLEGQLLDKCRALTIKDFTDTDTSVIADTLDLDVTPKTLPNIIERFEDIIDDAFKAMDGREANYMTFMGYKIYLTGGLSWGDVPTDAFLCFDNFNSLPECLHALLK
jgi:hypothetical protein